MSEQSKHILLIVKSVTLKSASAVAFLQNWHRGGEVIVQKVEDINLQNLEKLTNCQLAVIEAGDGLTGEIGPTVISTLKSVSPNLPVVVLSDVEDPEEVIAALRAGAAGYISATLQPEIATGVLAFVLAGGTYVPPSVLTILDEESEPPGPRDRALKPGANGPAERPAARPVGQPILPPLKPDPNGGVASGPSLTDRQAEVLAQLRGGRSNKEIARELGMSEATVKVHVRQLMRKLGGQNRTQLAILAAARSAPSAQVVSIVQRERAAAPYGVLRN